MPDLDSLPESRPPPTRSRQTAPAPPPPPQPDDRHYPFARRNADENPIVPSSRPSSRGAGPPPPVPSFSFTAPPSPPRHETHLPPYTPPAGYSISQRNGGILRQPVTNTRELGGYDGEMMEEAGEFTERERRTNPEYAAHIDRVRRGRERREREAHTARQRTYVSDLVFFFFFFFFFPIVSRFPASAAP